MRARACACAEAGEVPRALTLPSGTRQGSLQAPEAASGRLRADAQASTDLRPARPGSSVRQHRTAHHLPGQPGHLRHGDNMAALRSSPRARVARLLGCGLHLRQEIRFREHQRLPRLRRRLPATPGPPGRLPMRLTAIPPTRACRLRQWSSAPATPIVTHKPIVAHIGKICSTAVTTCCTRPPGRWRPYLYAGRHTYRSCRHQDAQTAALRRCVDRHSLMGGGSDGCPSGGSSTPCGAGYGR